MQLSLDLKYKTPEEWGKFVISDLDSFLQDHADCERKASAMAMSFVAKCPDKIEIIPELIETALEELEHFKLVYELMEKRKVQLPKSMPKDPYIDSLMRLCYSDPERRLLDRFLLASILEIRGAERFKLISDAVDDTEIKQFYKMLWISEAKHGHIYVKFALNYWDKDTIYNRLNELNEKESEICEQLKWRHALH